MPEEVKVNTPPILESKHEDESRAALHEEYGSHLPNLLEPQADAPIVTQAKPSKPLPAQLIVAIALIVLCISGVGALSYLGYQGDQQAKSDKAALQGRINDLQQQLNVAKQQLSEAHAGTGAEGSQASSDQLKVPELGVAVPLTVGLDDLAYTPLQPSSSSPTDMVVGFTSASLRSAAGVVSPASSATFLLGTLTKSPESRRPAGGYKSGKLVATVAGTDYVYTAPASLSKPAAAVSIQTSQAALLQAALTKLTLIK